MYYEQNIQDSNLDIRIQYILSTCINEISPIGINISKEGIRFPFKNQPPNFLY